MSEKLLVGEFEFTNLTLEDIAIATTKSQMRDTLWKWMLKYPS